MNTVTTTAGPAVAQPSYTDGRERIELAPLRKAAILIVSLEDSLARKVLPQLDREDVDAVSLEIGRLEGIDPEEQQAVLEEFSALMMKRLRFVFEDLLRMDERELRAAYHEDDEPTWALALAGASRPLRMKVLAALETEREARLRRAMGALGPFRLDDVEAAQAEVAERLRRLHDLGRISLPEPDGREEILV
jgi:flagellar motor switch protein FliG